MCYIYSTKSWKKLMFDLLSHVFAAARACYLLVFVSEELCNSLLLELISFLPASDVTFFLFCFVRLTWPTKSGAPLVALRFALSRYLPLVTNSTYLDNFTSN